MSKVEDFAVLGNSDSLAEPSTNADPASLLDELAHDQADFERTMLEHTRSPASLQAKSPPMRSSTSLEDVVINSPSGPMLPGPPEPSLLPPAQSLHGADQWKSYSPAQRLSGQDEPSLLSDDAPDVYRLDHPGGRDNKFLLSDASDTRHFDWRGYDLEHALRQRLLHSTKRKARERDASSEDDDDVVPQAATLLEAERSTKRQEAMRHQEAIEARAEIKVDAIIADAAKRVELVASRARHAMALSEESFAQQKLVSSEEDDHDPLQADAMHQADKSTRHQEMIEEHADMEVNAIVEDAARRVELVTSRARHAMAAESGDQSEDLVLADTSLGRLGKGDDSKKVILTTTVVAPTVAPTVAPDSLCGGDLKIECSTFNKLLSIGYRVKIWQGVAVYIGLLVSLPILACLVRCACEAAASIICCVVGTCCTVMIAIVLVLVLVARDHHTTKL
jgi:hypothetical protein